MLGVLRLLALAVVIVIAGGALVLWLVWRDMSGPDRLAELPRVEVLAQLGIAATEAEAVVFEDGADGWFVIRDPVQLEGVEIGFFGTRVGDAMFGARHIPLYCGDPGKVLWAVAAEDTVGQLAFCSPARMDLSALRPLAEPVTLRREHLPRADIEALRAELGPGAEKVAVALPDAFEPFDLTRTLTTPAYWSRYSDDSATRFDLRDDLEAALIAHLADHAGDYTLRIIDESPGERTNYVAVSGGGSVPGETGPVMAMDGRSVILTDIDWIGRFRVDFACMPAACAALDGFDAEPVVRPGRDHRLLDTALERRLDIDLSGEAIGWTEAMLRAAGTRIDPAAEALYYASWVEPRR